MVRGCTNSAIKGNIRSFPGNSEDFHIRIQRADNPMLNSLAKEKIRKTHFKIMLKMLTQIKPNTSKKVFESMQLLTAKRLTTVEGKEKIRNDLNSLAFKRSEIKLEIAEKERNIICFERKNRERKA